MCTLKNISWSKTTPKFLTVLLPSRVSIWLDTAFLRFLWQSTITRVLLEFRSRKTLCIFKSTQPGSKVLSYFALFWTFPPRKSPSTEAFRQYQRGWFQSDMGRSEHCHLWLCCGVVRAGKCSALHSAVESARGK